MNWRRVSLALWTAKTTGCQLQRQAGAPVTLFLHAELALSNPRRVGSDPRRVGSLCGGREVVWGQTRFSCFRQQGRQGLEGVGAGFLNWRYWRSRSTSLRMLGDRWIVESVS